MKISASQRDKIRSVVSRYEAQYRGSNRPLGDGRNPQNVLAQLKTLDLDTASADDVNAIVGNTSWTDPEGCDECGRPSWDCVQIGQEPDYESSTATVCLECLEKAIQLVRGSTP
jgi:hypothetical protein